MYRFMLAMCCTLLASCASQIAPDDAVRDSQTAVRIGSAECLEGADTHNFTWYQLTHNWSATLSGDQWTARRGVAKGWPGTMYVSITKRDGKVGQCMETIPID